MLYLHVLTGNLGRPVQAQEINSDAPCCILAPGLGLHAGATVAGTAFAASACGCRFGRGRSFGLSFERLCSPGENKGKI